MEPNDTQLPQLSSYFHHHHHHSSTPSSATAPASTNGGLLPPPTATTNNNTNSDNTTAGGTHSQSHPITFPHSVAVTSTLEPAKRKRGRPRKYGTPEQALAAKKTASSSSNSAKERRDYQQHQPSLLASSAFNKSHDTGFGNLGQGFTPHVIDVAAGEDVSHKIMVFMQQSKREICILSASGSISNASLRQPATSGGNITYEGRFEIVSLSGSYVRTEIGGRTGGLSVCLSSTDGHIIGGGVGGPLKAAGPVQVIVGTFLIDTKKDSSAGLKIDASGSKMPSPVGGASISSVGFRSPVDSSGRSTMRGNDDYQPTIGGSHFMMQPGGMNVTPSRVPEWRSGLDARNSTGFDMSGRGAGHGAHQSPENGDYDQMGD